MALAGPTDVVAWMAGHDLAGVGALTRVTDELEGMFADRTSLNDDFEHEDPLGRVKYTLSEAGYLDDAATSLRKLLVAGAPAEPWVSVLGRFGAAQGKECRIATGMRIERPTIVPEVNQFTQVAIDYKQDAGGVVVSKARIVNGGTRIDGEPPEPYNATRFDLGAAAPDGVQAVVMVDSDVEWDGGTELAVYLASNDVPDGTAPTDPWARIGAMTDQVTVQPNMGAGAVLIETDAAVDRYVAVVLDWTGAGPDASAKILAAIKPL